MTRLAGALPKGQPNGLEAIATQLVGVPEDVHLIIATVDTKKISTDIDTGDVEATVRILRIEAVLDDDVAAAKEIMRRALERRTGEAPLPFEEDGVMIDPITGEALDGEDGDEQ